MKLRLLLVICALSFSGLVFADYTRGYIKKNGTYVQPHHKTHPDQYRYNNYSAKGNINPYTGKSGTQRHEFSNPPKYNKSYGKNYSPKSR